MSEEKYDVCVVGGGLIGLCSAYQLTRRKLKVVVVERAEKVAAEASGNNGAVTWPFTQMLSEPFLYRFVLDGIQAHKRLSDSGIKYDFRLIGAIQLFFSDLELRHYEKQLKELPSTERYEMLERKELHDLEPAYSDNIVGGVLYPNCSQGTAEKLGIELANSLLTHGAEIRTLTEAKSFRKTSRRIESVKTNEGEIAAKYFVIAAGPWCNAFSDDLEFGIPTFPVKGHLLTWKVPGTVTSHLMLPRRGALLPTPEGSVRAGGGMDYTGYRKTPDERVVRILTNAAVEAIPSLAKYPYDVWTGLRPGTPDALPILGYADLYENLVIAAGHYHEGFSTSAITGEIVSDLIVEGKSKAPYLGMYRPGRFDC